MPTIIFNSLAVKNNCRHNPMSCLAWRCELSSGGLKIEHMSIAPLGKLDI